MANMQNSVDGTFSAEQQAQIRDQFNALPDQAAKDNYKKQLMDIVQKETARRAMPIDKNPVFSSDPTEVANRIKGRQLNAVDRISADGTIYNTFQDNDGKLYYGNGTLVPPHIVNSTKEHTYANVGGQLKDGKRNAPDK